MSLNTLTKSLIIGAVASSMFGCASTPSTTSIPTAELSGAKVDIKQLSGSWEDDRKPEDIVKEIKNARKNSIKLEEGF